MRIAFLQTDEQGAAAPRGDRAGRRQPRRSRREICRRCRCNPCSTEFAPVAGQRALRFRARSKNERVEIAEEKMSGGISLPRSHLILLVCAAAAIAMVLGYNLAPLIQSKLKQRGRSPCRQCWLRLNRRSPTQRSLLRDPAIETGPSN